MILTAVVLFANCHFDATRYTVKEEFEQTYPPLRDQLKDYLTQYEDPAEFYNFLVQINDGGGDFDPLLQQILNAALTDKTLRRTIDYVNQLDGEIKAVETAQPSWRDSPVGKALLEDLTVTKSFALSDAGDLARSRMERVVRELGELNKQGKKILVETAKAETDALDQQVKDQSFEGTTAGPANQFAADDEHIYWSFEGEYWRDELGYYLYNIDSKCGR
jgi:hypothetical protein